MADYDVLIAGGGPVGASLALALHGSGFVVGCSSRGRRGPRKRIRAPLPCRTAAG